MARSIRRSRELVDPLPLSFLGIREVPFCSDCLQSERLAVRLDGARPEGSMRDAGVTMIDVLLPGTADGGAVLRIVEQLGRQIVHEIAALRAELAEQREDVSELRVAMHRLAAERRALGTGAVEALRRIESQVEQLFLDWAGQALRPRLKALLDAHGLGALIGLLTEILAP